MIQPPYKHCVCCDSVMEGLFADCTRRYCVECTVALGMTYEPHMRGMVGDRFVDRETMEGGHESA